MITEVANKNAKIRSSVYKAKLTKSAKSLTMVYDDHKSCNQKCKNQFEWVPGEINKKCKKPALGCRAMVVALRRLVPGFSTRHPMSVNPTVSVRSSRWDTGRGGLAIKPDRVIVL